MPLRLRVISESRELPRDQRLREFRAVGGTIGRGADNDWTLPCEKRFVSARHAVIDYQGGAYYLVDTSRNGVFVNGADTPVGKGHPQRLFDGDTIRIGEFEIAVSITSDDGESSEDGMRDSIVRAQLVPEEESVELQLVAEDKLISDHTFQRHLAPATDLVKQGRKPPTLSVKQSLATPNRQPPKASVTPLVTPAREPSRPAPPASAGAAPNASPAIDAERRALTALLAGAGLVPDAVSGATAAEILQISGKLLRACVVGLTEMLRDRAELKDQFRLPGATVQGTPNNPLRFAPTVDEALKFLLADRGQGSYLGSEEAMAAAFRDLRQHDHALIKAMRAAVEDYVQRFDPDELKAQFDKRLKRGALLASANKIKYWELYEESYQALTQRDESGPPQLFAEDFARAYVEEVDAAQVPGRSRP